MKSFLSQKSGLDLNHVLISTPSWAFRTCIRKFGKLDTPFLAFRPIPGGISKPDHIAYKNWAITNGFFFDDVGDRVKIHAYDADYSCVFWCNLYESAAAFFERRIIDNYRENLVPYTYIVNGKPYEFMASLEYTHLELDPDYEDQEQLQKGNLHSVQLDMRIGAHVIHGSNYFGGADGNGAQIQLATGAEMQFFYNNGELPPSPGAPDPSTELYTVPTPEEVQDSLGDDPTETKDYTQL